MKWYFYIPLIIAVYIGFTILVSRVLGFNSRRYGHVNRHNRRSGTDRRQKWAPVAVDRRIRAERRRLVPLNQRGAVVVVVAVFGMVFIGFMALALGTGQMTLGKGEAANAADASALGCAAAFYDPEDGTAPGFVYPDRAAQAATSLALSNGGDCTATTGHYNPMGSGTWSAGGISHLPDWATIALDEVYVDTTIWNACRVECTFGGIIFFSDVAFNGSAVAVAMKNMVAVEAGGVEVLPGSKLTQ
jgi:hypothetical protein